MSTTRLEKIYAVLLLIIFGGVIFHAPLSVGLGVIFPDASLFIKAWKEILMILLVPVAGYLITVKKMWPPLLNDWIFRIIILFAALHFWLAALMYTGTKATVAGLLIDLRYILFFCLVFVLLTLMPDYKKWFIRVGVIGAFIVVCFATLQLFLPPNILSTIGYSKTTIAPYLTVDKNPDYIRVNSTLRGPNPLGAYAGMVLAFLTAVLVRGKLKLSDKKTLIGTLILGVCSIVALWISYSRSALVGGVVAAMVVLFAVWGRRLSRNGWITLCVITVALVGAIAALRGSDIVSNVIFHENLNGGSTISSNEGHISSLKESTFKLVQHPFGFGVGSTGSASLIGGNPTLVENQYLFVGHETGWLGMALFVLLYALILIRIWQNRANWINLGVFASGVGLALIGLLLPVWVDDTVSIVWWGLAAVALAGGEYVRKQTKQKTTRAA